MKKVEVGPDGKSVSTRQISFLSHGPYEGDLSVSSLQSITDASCVYLAFTPGRYSLGKMVRPIEWDYHEYLERRRDGGSRKEQHDRMSFTSRSLYLRDQIRGEGLTFSLTQREIRFLLNTSICKTLSCTHSRLTREDRNLRPSSSLRSTVPE